MPVARVILVLVIVGFLTVGAASAIDDAYEDSGQIANINGETVNTGGVGSLETLEESNVGGALYTDRPTITNGSGIIMNQGADYHWHPNNGTFHVLSSQLANDNGVTVDYSYTIPNQNQGQIASLFGDVFDGLAPLMMLFLVVAAIIGAMVRFGA